ncbi:MAG: Abi family protein [Bacteriovorax sp.]|nr:Abi family protein [Bacteriovorax sp.]
MRNLATKIEDYLLFHHIHKDLSPLVNGLSRPRLSSYNHLGNHTTCQQIRKYQYNMRLSLEFFNLISFLEILLRNSISSAWANHLKEDFPMIHSNFELNFGYETDSKTKVFKLDRRGNKVKTKQFENILKAYKAGSKTANTQSRAMINGDVISNLMFGFWRFCFDAHFISINQTQISWIFPHHDMNKRKPEAVAKKVRIMLDEINDLRNRIAHHDKIFHKKEIRKVHLFYILTLIKWIDPKALHFSNYKRINILLESGWSFFEKSIYDDFPPNTF